MNCDSFVFTKGKFLNTSCGLNGNTYSYYTDFFTGYDNIEVSFDDSSVYGYICEYDSPSSSGSRSNLQQGLISLDSSKYYRVSVSTPQGYSYKVSPYCANAISQVYTNLNSITSNKIYTELSPITPFLIFLVIFSFSFFVLKKVIRSSSKGNINV